MGWRDALRPGRFRDAPFFCAGARGDLGRRVALHEYPLRDLPYAEDLGRRARQWQMELYVVGPDYMAARDKLVAALEQPGPGTLVHPYLGSLRVVVSQASGPEESSEAGGMARFSVTFVEAGELRQPAAVSATSDKVRARAATAAAEAKADFGRRFSVAGWPAHVSDAAQGLVAKGIDGIRSASGLVPAVPDKATSLSRSLDQASSGLAGLLRQPTQLAGQVQGLISGLAGLYQRPAAAYAALKTLWDFGADEPAVTGTTPSRRAMAANQAATVDLVRRSAVIEAAQTTADMEWTTRAEASATQIQVLEAIDEISESAPDALYEALVALRAAVAADIATRGADLARLAAYTPGQTEPALVVAYRVYGDAAREADVVARNRVRHPGFVEPRRLEVLVDA
ncbi:hypothetical protein G3N55_00075 [Dissulfurirhabdus thermomarina]|uniref:DNA circulation N-terminal domain-containing protein n=1 Tax=Dissulfurirhabdus thermomarina TaxID=1765737 RepID=A0A6N9TRP0_DISTH|nr:DNA circularization N-terminal domain-containing protein [Dissulfurirhabdus thermomarina]NDY41246.1 hypothetical protein [Dissulfurirhabdus thermomarina]